MIDPKPPGLKDVPLGIEFTSTMAVAQRAASTGGIERMLAMVGNMAAVFPQAPDNVDPDALISLMNGLLGNPERILRGPEQLKGIRDQRQQQQDKMQQAQMAEHAANTASTGADAANTLANTQIGGGASALSQMLGTGAGG